jgi:hypothetical protein
VRILGRGERPRADDDERRRDRIHGRLEVTAPPAVMRCDQHIRAEVAATFDEATPPGSSTLYGASPTAVVRVGDAVLLVVTIRMYTIVV